MHTETHVERAANGARQGGEPHGRTISTNKTSLVQLIKSLPSH